MASENHASSRLAGVKGYHASFYIIGSYNSHALSKALRREYHHATFSPQQPTIRSSRVKKDPMRGYDTFLIDFLGEFKRHRASAQTK